MTIDNRQFVDSYLHELGQIRTHGDGGQYTRVKNINHWNNIAESLMSKDISDNRVWVWSDTHFFHENIIKYANRPFVDATSMTTHMISEYKRLVQPDDVVIWGGDIAFKGHAIVNELLSALPGYKIHIIGNHDMDRKGKVIPYMMDERHLCYQYDINGITVLFTHYPMDSVPPGCVNVHGHIHNNIANNWNINMCVEHTYYAPILIEQLIQSAIK